LPILKLKPIPVHRPWGGRLIAAYLGQELPSGRIGELIQASDETEVASGPFAGQTLARVVERFGPDLLGRPPGPDTTPGPARRKPQLARSGARPPAPDTRPLAPGCPLVVRFLDAPHWGPIHVHPTVPGQPWAGAELWHVLAAHEGSGAVLGLDPAVADLSAILDRPIGEQVRRRAIRAGETILIPPGTVHALGGGALVYGVQVAGFAERRSVAGGAGA